MCKNLSFVLTAFELTVKLPWRNKQQKGQYAKAILSSVWWQVAYYAARDKYNHHPTMLYCSIFRYLYSVCQIKLHVSSECSRWLQHFAFCMELKSVLGKLLPHNKNSFLNDISRYLDGQRSYCPLLYISTLANLIIPASYTSKNMIHTHWTGKRVILFAVCFQSHLKAYTLKALCYIQQ